MIKIKCYLRLLLFLIIVNFIGIINVYAVNNPYKKNSSYGVNCTWYAWKMANEKANVVLPGWGNAKNWYNDAKKSGYTVGTTPKANSIVVWGDWTSYGHVGYVEKVDGNILYVWDSTGPCIDREDPEYIDCIANGVSEETDRICNANAKKVACKIDINDPYGYTETGYIYLDYAPKIQQSTKKEETQNTEVVKSSNANLSHLKINNISLDISKKITEYTLEVDNNIDSIDIIAKSEDNKAKIKGNGTYKLIDGLNKFKIIVTAEKGNTKEYFINVTRKQIVADETNLNNENIDNILTTEDSKEPKSLENTDYNQLILIGILVVGILIILLLILKRRKHK